jgi:hypothetical protein
MMIRYFITIVVASLLMVFCAVLLFSGVAHARPLLLEGECHVALYEEILQDVCNINGELMRFPKADWRKELDEYWNSHRARAQARNVYEEVSRAHALSLEERRIEVLGRLEQLGAPKINVSASSSSSSSSAVKNNVRAVQKVEQSA